MDQKETIEKLRAFYTTIAYPGECMFDMNSDDCMKYEGHCEMCVFDHACRSL